MGQFEIPKKNDEYIDQLDTEISSFGGTLISTKMRWNDCNRKKI